MRFNPTNHHNPCPICQDASGDCRTTPDSLVLCHSFIDFDSGIAGWRWRGASSNGVWGVHVPDDGKEFNREQYERYLAQKEAQERDKKQFLAEEALDAEGRDKAIRKLARVVGLNDRCRKDLRNRGLSDRNIDEGLFFSIDPWTRFNLSLPKNLPGIHYKGDRFATRDSGYACVIFDKQGRAIGWQLRVEGVTEGNKYKWAKSSFSSHLPNGELPITLVKPIVHEDKRLYLSEGILKPYVASHRHNLAICGGAGGHFQGSPEQLTSIVSDYEELVIAPDGGDVLNPQVMQRWSKQINFLERFKKPIKILWWGQVEKFDNDLDEIDSVTFLNAKHLTPEEFWEIARKQQIIKQHWSQWRNYKKFTPQIKIEQEFIEYGLPQSNTITFIKSGLGTGKTTETIKHLLQLQEYGIIGLGYRNTLLLQFNEKAKKIGFYHLQSDKNLEEFSLDDLMVKVTNCIDSLLYYKPEQFDGKIIIIDEVISVIKHLLFSPTIKNFSKIKELFTEMVKRADRIICLDGFMQDWAVDFFRELCPAKEIVTIENTFKGNKPQVHLLEGTIDVEEKVRVNDKTPWVKKALLCDCPALATDSQIFCESMENLFKEQGREGIRIDSKTVSEPNVKDFFINPAEEIAKTQPEYMNYSPSAESGLDVSVENYFSELYAFFFGNLDVDSSIQQVARVRDVNVARLIWAKKFIAAEDSARRPSNVESIQADRARSLMAELNSVIEDTPNLTKEQISSRIQQIYQDSQDPFTKAADIIRAIRNHEFANYRECLKEQLIEAGYPVDSVTPDKLRDDRSVARQEKSAKTEVKEQNSQDIYDSSDEYIGKEESHLKFDADWKTRCALSKANLVNRLPRINRESVWSPEFIKLVKYDKPNLIASAALYYLLENTDVAKLLAKAKYNRIFNRGKIAAPWKLRSSYLKVKALHNIGLYDFIQKAIADPEYTYVADSPEVVEILNKCSWRKNQAVLGTPGKDPIKFLHKLIRGVGIESRSRVVREGKSVVRHYFIDRDWLDSPERIAIALATKLKYEEKINSLSAPLDWVSDEPKIGENQPAKKIDHENVETADTIGDSNVTLDPHFSINNRAKCNNQKPPDLDSNSEPNLHSTEIIQNSLDSESAIADLAEMLTQLESRADLAFLASLGEAFSSSRLNRAVRRLSRSWQSRIRRWAILNCQDPPMLA